MCTASKGPKHTYSKGLIAISFDASSLPAWPSALSSRIAAWEGKVRELESIATAAMTKGLVPRWSYSCLHLLDLTVPYLGYHILFYELASKHFAQMRDHFARSARRVSRTAAAVSLAYTSHRNLIKGE